MHLNIQRLQSCRQFVKVVGARESRSISKTSKNIFKTPVSELPSYPVGFSCRSCFYGSLSVLFFWNIQGKTYWSIFNTYGHARRDCPFSSLISCAISCHVHVPVDVGIMDVHPSLFQTFPFFLSSGLWNISSVFQMWPSGCKCGGVFFSLYLWDGWG